MKTKKKVAELITADEAVSVMQDYAESTSKLKSLEAEIELQVQAIRDKHQHNVNALQADAKDASDKLIRYAEFNKKTLFKDGKTIDLQHGTISIRLGTPRVDKIRSLTWDAALDKIRKISENFIRVKEEVDKEEIIANRDEKDLMAKLNKIGINVVQDEAITVKSKEEELIES